MTAQPEKLTPEKLRDLYGDDPERILGMRLKALREEAGVTQRHLAEQMTGQGFPMHQTTIGKIEKNERPVTVNEAAMLASLLGLQLPDLLADPELNEEVSQLRAELQQVSVQRLEAETERSRLRAEEAAVKQRLAEAGRRWLALQERERDLQARWLLARKRSRGRAPEGG